MQGKENTNKKRTGKSVGPRKPVFRYTYPFGTAVDVVFILGRYRNNNNLYVGLEDARTGEPFTDVTKNFEPLDNNDAHIKNFDENEGMVQFLIQNDLGYIMGNLTEDYPLFFFNPLRLMEVDPDGYKRISDGQHKN